MDFPIGKYMIVLQKSGQFRRVLFAPQISKIIYNNYPSHPFVYGSDDMSRIHFFLPYQDQNINKIYRLS